MVEIIESAHVVYPQDTEYVSDTDASFYVRFFFQSVCVDSSVRSGRESEKTLIAVRRVALVGDAAPNSLY